MDPDGAGGTPPETLAGLARSGDLARRYPEVRGLLAGLADAPDADAVRAGRLLSRVTADDVRAAHPDVPGITVAVTGNGVLNGLAPGITGQAARHGIVADVAEPEFDAWVRDLADRGRPFGAAQLAVVVLDAAVATSALPGPWTADDLAEALDEKVGLLASLAERFAARSTATLVVTTVPLPRPVLTQLVDHRSRARLSARWRAANQRLLELPGVTTIDLDTLVAEGIPVTDHRLSVYAKAHLSPDLLARLAREVGHLARAATGRTSKVLALDLDGTVWGGVLGDDGIEGIEVADSYRGEAFRAFQRTVRQLGAQGVLVAAVSKNDLQPVRQVLREHPRTTLREDDFVRVIANWQPKPDNLRQLAADLNLGLDSVVFVDDTPYEIGLVRKELPDVVVVPVDDEPALHVVRLLRDGWFDVTEVTADDRARPARYQEEVVRKDFLDSFDSIQDYVRELDVRVRVARATAWDLPRIAQITQRTNQFNLTTRRLTLADVQRLASAPDGYALGVHASDRFGDNGLVGAVLAHREDGVLHLDNVLLSCRVFARGIEQAVLAALLARAKAEGLTSVEGTFRRSPRNGKVHDLYPRAGFTTVSDDGSEAVFRHALDDIGAPPGHVHLETDWEQPSTPERTAP